MKPSAAAEARAFKQEACRRIGASMKRWQLANEYGRSVGRGLSSGEILDKVARETGASKTLVRFALKKAA